MRTGILTKVFTAEPVDAAIAEHDRAERRRRLLPARLVVHFGLGPVSVRPGSYGVGPEGQAATASRSDGAREPVAQPSADAASPALGAGAM
ncbi:transposase domain-containing protein [Streptomyces sp. NPDC004327]|uniref:transposase domain-containing protein n=1 Tax=Streptomyces sp. NPDC004327 TaxID=3364699 RepID=UPI0036890AF6